jgi:hypothetical protein
MDTILQHDALSSKRDVKSTSKVGWIMWQNASEIYVHKSKYGSYLEAYLA